MLKLRRYPKFCRPQFYPQTPKIKIYSLLEGKGILSEQILQMQLQKLEA